MVKTSHKNGQSDRPRAIRIFVSSTFRDLADERDALVKKAFPALRKICEERSVAWSEVDLRWGITDEQRAEGKVLPICLAEIKNCRPYFIGLLGERYGWVPKRIAPDLINRERWLKKHKGKSVTELEIIYGVLKNPEMAGHAYFYLRDPSYLDTLDAAKKEEFSERSTNRIQKLAQLKQKIKESEFPKQVFSNPEHLVRLVFDDLKKVIDNNFPEKSIPDPLEREALEHKIFAESRHRFYIKSGSYNKTLLRHANSTSKPLVVIGESGSGKSALLANFYLHFLKNFGNNIIIHFIGSTPQSTDLATLIRRLMMELKFRYEIKDKIPSNDADLRENFAKWLYVASGKGKTIIILDALNQLDDKQGARELLWLPDRISPNVRLILSTVPGISLNAINDRKWNSLEISPLNIDQTKIFVSRYLKQYRKSLSHFNMAAILKSKYSHNPLFLKSLLEELRVYGYHSTLKKKIKYYLSINNIDDLFNKILERYEDDYNTERPNLVKDSMSLIYAARKGLSESELMQLLGENDNPLPKGIWSPFFSVAELSFNQRSGIIGFSHEYLRKAVEKRFLKNSRDSNAYHKALSRYFESEKGGIERKIEELPWQYAKLHAWRNLVRLLSDPKFLKSAWKTRRFDIEYFWALVENSSPYRVKRSYYRVLRNPLRYKEVIIEVSTLLRDLGHSRQSIKLYRFLIDHYKKTRQIDQLPRLLNELANILIDLGDTKQVLELLNKSEALARNKDRRSDLADAVSLKALTFQNMGNISNSLKLHIESIALFRKLKSKEGLATCYNNMAVIYHNQGKMIKAKEYYELTEKLCREIDDIEGIQTAKGNIAYLLVHFGSLEKALELFLENEQVYRNMGNLDGLRYAIGCQGMVYNKMGQSQKALKLFEKSLDISHQIGHKEWIGWCSGQIGLIKKDNGDIRGAMELFRSEEKIYRQIQEMDYLPACLIEQADIYRTKGNFKKAAKLINESERLCRRLDFKPDLIQALYRKALLLLNKGRDSSSLQILNSALKLSNKIKDQEGKARGLSIKAKTLDRKRNKNDKALQLYKEALNIARQSKMVRLEKEIIALWNNPITRTKKNMTSK